MGFKATAHKSISVACISVWLGYNNNSGNLNLMPNGVHIRRKSKAMYKRILYTSS